VTAVVDQTPLLVSPVEEPVPAPGTLDSPDQSGARWGPVLARLQQYGPPVLGCLLLALAVLAGCASVPESSPVQVLRQVGGGEDALVPPGPVAGSNPLDLVRDFVFASGSSTERHGAARRFLAAEAEGWDDAAGLTVLDGQFDTVPAPGAASPSFDTTTIRIRGTAIGRLTPSGSFEPGQTMFQQDVTVVRRDGQWRISDLPPGVVVPLSVFRDNYKPVRTWFVDPVRRLAVADVRHVPSVPSRAQAARVMELLLAGPSGALTGAAVSLLPPGAQLRANVTTSEDGAVVVDLTRLGDLDEPSRMLLAAQVVLSLSEVNVGRVRLLADGEPLLPDRRDLTREDVAGLSAEIEPGADVPGLVVAGGRVRQLTGPEPSAPLPGPLGNGAYDVESAASTVDGRRIAAVYRAGGQRTLLVGGLPEGGVTPVPLTADDMTALLDTHRRRGVDGHGFHRGRPRARRRHRATSHRPGQRRRARGARADPGPAAVPGRHARRRGRRRRPLHRCGRPHHRRRGRDPQRPPAAP
jgi:hypothetical protein